MKKRKLIPGIKRAVARYLREVAAIEQRHPRPKGAESLVEIVVGALPKGLKAYVPERILDSFRVKARSGHRWHGTAGA